MKQNENLTHRPAPPLTRAACPGLFLFLLSIAATAQSDSSSWNSRPGVSFSGFVDVFYAYDFNEPSNGYRQSFLYNHNRHNEFAVNLGLARIAALHPKYRANIALQAGTYVTDNYAAEPAALRHLYEANAGFSLSRNKKLWLDAGIFGSHIGFESAISKDSWTPTRSLPAENSPYYLSGAKISFIPDAHWELAAIVCNGWQRIKKTAGNSLPAFCTQVKYLHGDRLTLNWSTFIGTDDPDSTRRMRYFNNFYAQAQPAQRLGLIAGFDIGAQQSHKRSSAYEAWFSPVLIARCAVSDQWSCSLRGEYYDDRHGVIIDTGTPGGFKTSGLSFNTDYAPVPNLLCRLEARWFNSADKIFPGKNSSRRDDYFLLASLAASF